MRRSLLGLALTPLLLPAIAAAAGPIEVGRIYSGPALAGESIVWAEQPGRPLAVVKAVSLAGGDRRVLASIVREQGAVHEIFLGPTLAGSATRVAVGVNAGRSFYKMGSVHAIASWAGPPEGPLERLSGYCGVGEPITSHVVDVSGERVAYDDCESGTTVRDHSGAVPPRTFPVERYVRLAGSYLAAFENDSESFRRNVVVYDTDTGLLAYRLRAADLPGDAVDLDVAEDGSVAITLISSRSGTWYDRPGSSVAWASPANPAPITVPLPRKRTYHVRMARPGLIAYAGSPRWGSWGRAEIGTVDPAGNRRVLVRDARDTWMETGFDADAERIAWFGFGCAGARLHVTRLDAAPIRARHATGCPLRMRGPQAFVSPSGRIRVFPNCYGFESAPYCVKRRSFTVHGTGPHAGLLIAAGGQWNRLTMTPRGRGLLRRKRSLHVRGVATLRDSLGRRDRRSGAFRLRFCAPDDYWSQHSSCE